MERASWRPRRRCWRIVVVGGGAERFARGDALREHPPTTELRTALLAADLAEGVEGTQGLGRRAIAEVRGCDLRPLDPRDPAAALRLRAFVWPERRDRVQRLDVELPALDQQIAELEAKIDELRYVQDDSAFDISEEIGRLQKKSQTLTKDIYAKLTAWQIAQVARHPRRPYTLDYIEAMFTDFQELHGDRAYADDAAIVGGLARFNGKPCMVIGHQKGRDVKERSRRNFGMPRPEGYRKALRLMETAEKFGLPLFTFVDTPGAYPGVGAEERGQSEAIGRNLYVMSELGVPIITTVIGEGGSGGALAIAVADQVLDRKSVV